MLVRAPLSVLAAFICACRTRNRGVTRALWVGTNPEVRPTTSIAESKKRPALSVPGGGLDRQGYRLVQSEDGSQRRRAERHSCCLFEPVVAAA